MSVISSIREGCKICLICMHVSVLDHLHINVYDYPASTVFNGDIDRQSGSQLKLKRQLGMTAYQASSHLKIVHAPEVIFARSPESLRI